MKKNHHARNSHIYKLYEIKSYNLRPEMHHLTVRVNNNNNNNNNNNYAAVCKESCKLTNFSIQVCHATWQKNKRLERWTQLSFRLRLHWLSLWGFNVMNEQVKTKDSKGELINSLSGSDCIGLAYWAVTWWTNDSNPKTCQRRSEVS